MELLDYGSSDEDDGGRDQEPPKRSKVLKLASVLPQHILDRLTKRSNDDGDDDSSSDDDGSASPTSKKRKEKTGSTTTRISSLLINLTEFKPKHSSLALQRSPFDLETSIVDDTTAAPPPESRIGCANSSSLGESFLRPKITIESKGQSTVTVRDIHAESHLGEPVMVAQPVDEAPHNHNVHPGTKMKRPVIQAAPPVRSTRELEETSETMGSSDVSLQASTKSAAQHFTTKKSRQQLERELRRGNVGAVDGIAVDGVKPTDHTPNVVDYEAMTTIRNIPTTMYDPGSGQMKQAKVSKAKNQIHFLVHQASELERRRAEQGPARPSHRADAKRKYGF